MHRRSRDELFDLKLEGIQVHLSDNKSIESNKIHIKQIYIIQRDDVQINHPLK